ncbi:(2Fe-2S)-binding protein [Methyloraptor flagellatus]|uniref:(2Fe-2S)-binding protein n=1 Tax=Methyloraptor flagellatus TaxID=3162530 RepID=A0AAU7XFV2_9HYPH
MTDLPSDLSASQFSRLARADAAPIAFTIDGEPVTARAGDLLITAILVNRGAVRRFEFGDAMRAGFCLMGGCQDCWVDLADGRRLRACTVLVEPGMAVVTAKTAGGRP